MNNKIRLLLVIIALLVLSGGLYYINKLRTQAEVHYHAGFIVYLDDKIQDFSKPEYMALVPCVKGKRDHEKKLAYEKAHLHDNIGDVVHVEDTGGKWGDLFKNIGYHIDNNKRIESYVNGKKVIDIMNYSIQKNDSVVIFIGDHKTQIGEVKQVTQQHIEEIGKRSESCGE